MYHDAVTFILNTKIYSLFNQSLSLKLLVLNVSKSCKELIDLGSETGMWNLIWLTTWLAVVVTVNVVK